MGLNGYHFFQNFQLFPNLSTNDLKVLQELNLQLWFLKRQRACWIEIGNF